MVPGYWLLNVVVVGAASSARFPAVTWTSAGTSAGEAVLVGVVDSVTGSNSSSTFVQLHHAASNVTLTAPTLQRGNGSIMAQLPAEFRLRQWQLSLCTVLASSSTLCGAATVELYAPRVHWYSCTLATGGASTGCTAGGLLRVFGRNLAYDAGGCRTMHSTAPFHDGNELLLQLSVGAPATTATSTVTIAATEQSCYSATFLLPTTLAAGDYTLGTANIIGGDRGTWRNRVERAAERTVERLWVCVHVGIILPPPSPAPSLHKCPYVAVACLPLLFMLTRARICRRRHSQVRLLRLPTLTSRL